MLRIIYGVSFSFAAMMTFNACSIQQKLTRSLIEVEQVQARTFKVKDDIRVSLGLVLYAEIKAGTEWVFVGVIPEGDVFKSKTSVFSINDSDVHEAYLVIAQKSLVGFYLPYEKSFSKADKAVEITTINP